MSSNFIKNVHKDLIVEWINGVSFAIGTKSAVGFFSALAPFGGLVSILNHNAYGRPINYLLHNV